MPSRVGSGRRVARRTSSAIALGHRRRADGRGTEQTDPDRPRPAAHARRYPVARAGRNARLRCVSRGRQLVDVVDRDGGDDRVEFVVVAPALDVVAQVLACGRHVVPGGPSSSLSSSSARSSPRSPTRSGSSTRIRRKSSTSTGTGKPGISSCGTDRDERSSAATVVGATVVGGDGGGRERGRRDRGGGSSSAGATVVAAAAGARRRCRGQVVVAVVERDGQRDGERTGRRTRARRRRAPVRSRRCGGDARRGADRPPSGIAATGGTAHGRRRARSTASSRQPAAADRVPGGGARGMTAVDVERRRGGATGCGHRRQRASRAIWPASANLASIGMAVARAITSASRGSIDGSTARTSSRSIGRPFDRRRRPHRR